MAQLNQVLLPTWSHGNPVDVIGDAQADRYQKAVRVCLEDSNVDGVLAILTPRKNHDQKPLEAANTLIELSSRLLKNVFEAADARQKQAKKCSSRIGLIANEKSKHL